MDQVNEATLIEGARHGDRASQEAIVRLYERRVYGLVLRLVQNREDARDILQETMVKALTSINRYEGTYPFTSWLFRIATNKALDFLRRRKLEFRIFEYEGGGEGEAYGSEGGGGRGWSGTRSGSWSAGRGDDRGTAIDDLPDPGPLPDATASDRLDLALVERCLDRLAPKYRTVLHLRYRDDLAYKEIARVLSIPIGTVKILLHRGHAELKREVIQAMGKHPSEGGQ